VAYYPINLFAKRILTQQENTHTLWTATKAISAATKSPQHSAQWEMSTISPRTQNAGRATATVEKSSRRHRILPQEAAKVAHHVFST